MNRSRARFALVGVLALSICVAVGLMAGAAGAAKKKGKKKGANQVTVSKASPTAIPAGDATAGIAGVASVPLNVGKKAKGKVVSSVAVTYQLTDPAGNLDTVSPKLVAPNGRRLFIDNPAAFIGDSTMTVVGPLTTTPNSPIGYCAPNPTPPPPGCPAGDPDNILGPPFAGTAGDVDLALFNGIGARGTWTLKVINSSTAATHVLNSVRVQIQLANKPK
jgi:hypothetical protein